MIRHVLASAILLAIAAPVLAEQVDNPQYKTWASYKPGTYVTLKTTMEMSMGEGGRAMTSETTMTRKLLEVTPDKAVIETTVTSEMMGKKRELPASKQDVPAKIDKTDADKSYLPPSQGKATVKDVKTGKDNLEVAGKTLETTTHEATVEAEIQGQTMASHMKSWTNPEIPGGLVKAETTSDVPVKRTSTTALVDYKVEK